jgi:acetolactate synthase-1/2/3 large subunit
VAFGWIKCLLKLRCASKYFSVDFTPGDAAATARSFGLKALSVATPDDLENALDEAFACPAPVFLDIASEQEVDQLPPVYSWHQASGRDGEAT